MNSFSIVPRAVKATSGALLILFALIVPGFSRPIPANLGNGLDKLIESNLVLKGRLAAPARDTSVQPNGSTTVAGNTVDTFDGYATQESANFARAAIVDAVSNGFMVDI